MLQNYLPVLMLFVTATGFAGMTLLVSVLLGKTGTTNAVKDSAYECGMLPVGDGQARFSVKFYLVAVLFILFDIEAVFLFPWAILFKRLGMFGLIEMILFLLILGVGLTYVWIRGGLDWE